MIHANVIPAAAASATTQTLVVEATEKVCKPFCVLGSTPSASMAFRVGVLRQIGTYVIVPIIVTTTIMAAQGSSCAHTQVFNETFEVGFTATANNSISLAPGTEVNVTPASLACCKAKAVQVSTSLTITIA